MRYSHNSAAFVLSPLSIPSSGPQFDTLNLAIKMTDSQKSKREIPDGLKSVLETDVKLTKEFVELVNKKYPIAAYRSHLISLEVSELSNVITYHPCM